MAAVDPDLFRVIYAFAREHYDPDKASYHVSAELRSPPLAADVPRRTCPISSNSSTPGRSST